MSSLIDSNNVVNDVRYATTMRVEGDGGPDPRTPIERAPERTVGCRGHIDR